MLWGALNALVPQLEFINQLQSMRWLNKFAQGRWNQNQIVSEFAATLGVPSWLFLEVSMTKDGDPLNNGISSNNGANSENIVSLMNKAPIISNSKRPDFILGDNLPMTYNTNGKGTSWLVGDIKTSVVGMIHGYVNGYKTNPGSKLQFVAIANYAKKYTPGPIGLFICVKGGAPKVVLQSSLNDFIQLCISNAFAPVVVTLLGGTGKDADPVL